MRTLRLALILGITSTASSFADEAEIKEAARAIFDAANKPLPEFAQAVQAAQLPDFPAPGLESTGSTMTLVRDLVWKRLSAANMVVTANDKKLQLDDLRALCLVRSWVLRHHSYSNLVIASFVDEKLSTAVLASLSNGRIDAGEAKSILAALEPRTTAAIIVAVAMKHAPESLALREFEAQLATNKASSLIDLAESVSDERDELIDTRSSALMSGIRPASLISFAAQASGTSHMAQELAEYAAKGGDLNAELTDFMTGIAKIAPESIRKKDPALLMKFDAAMYAALLENVREWSAKQ